jgi:hypothetical protein
VIKTLKLLALIPMAIFEIIFLGVCWLVAFCHKPTGYKLTQWSLKTLPAKEWYLGVNSDKKG